MSVALPKTTGSEHDSDDIARTLKVSLESTVKGLSSFVRSLEQSGMNEAIPAYQRLYLLLAQQKLWSERVGRKDLELLWRQFSDEAGKIYGIMSPLAEVMKSIASVYELNSERARETAKSRCVDQLARAYSMYIHHRASYASKRRL